MKINYFVLETKRDQFSDFFTELNALGIDEKFISYTDGELSLNIEGTLLTCELDELPQMPDMHFYTLKYNDIVLCETRVKDSSRANLFNRSPGYTRSFVKTLYGLPDCLLADCSQRPPTSKERPDILYVVGDVKPTDLEMQHLFYVGIHPSCLIKIDNFFYFKLPGGREFTITKRYDDERTNKCEHGLQYRGVQIASTYQRDNIWLVIDCERIAEATKNLSNLINHPTSLSSIDENNLLSAVGTIEACANGIKNNLYSHFTNFVARKDDYITATLKYRNFDASNKDILFEALRHNTSLRCIRLRGITINGDDIINFIDILVNHPKNPILDLRGDCKFNLTQKELEPLLPQLVKLNLEVLNNQTNNDGISIYSLMKEYKSTASLVTNIFKRV